jgi:C-terminal processing protease CtpA/Prc
MRYMNFGVFEARRLRFNLGYVSFNMFGRPTAKAGEKVASAMQLLGDTAGLIVDLRDCHGGDTDTVTLTESYLVPAKTHLLDLYTRDDGKTEHAYAAAQLAGPRYAADKPIFVLISEDTASGCEAFAYTLQSQHRATLIGGHSAGAAHFGEPYKVTDHFMAFVANGRPIDPNTHGDWEGTGVLPTVAAAKDKALDRGELELLRVLAPREKSARRQASMQKRITELSK